MKKINKTVKSLLNKSCACVRKMHEDRHARSLVCMAAILKLYGDKKPYTKKQLMTKQNPFKFNILAPLVQTAVKKIIAPYIKPVIKNKAKTKKVCS